MDQPTTMPPAQIDVACAARTTSETARHCMRWRCVDAFVRMKSLDHGLRQDDGARPGPLRPRSCAWRTLRRRAAMDQPTILPAAQSDVACAARTTTETARHCMRWRCVDAFVRMKSLDPGLRQDNGARPSPLRPRSCAWRTPRRRAAMDQPTILPAAQSDVACAARTTSETAGHCSRKGVMAVR